MHFVVFGGSGDMGRRAALELARTPGVERVTVAGRSLASAQRAQSQIVETLLAQDPSRLSACEVAVAAVDAADQEAVARLMDDHHVAVGALGPFYLYEETMVRAAIDVRTPYVSICDDGDAAAAALALDEAARAKEVPILTGMGWTPGLSNLLARRAAAQLDQVTAVRIAWAGSSGPAPGPAVVLHTMHIFSGRVITYTGGRYRQVRAGSDPERVLFPEPLGALVVCHVGHPEPLTLPQHLPGVQEVSLKGGVVEPVLHHLAAWSGRLGLTGTHRRRERMAHWLRPFIPFFSRIGTGGLDPGAAGLVVRVEGRKDGQPCAIESAAADTIDGLTSVPLALGALWLARNAGQRVGVFPPEADGGPDPEQFLQDLAERGIRVAHNVET
ncbi:MAG TPA: saccharopine dehydrogenase NADP-binding domain-containing protein [Limnochordales bacterium]|nr:saccharopine dehydrogenase NADP-binding domain-containing protein [Limnochordales bacterium]